MAPPVLWLRTLAIALWLAAIFQSSCAVPLGPGFGHTQRQIVVRTDAAQPPKLHVRITDELVNVGNRDLSYLDVKLPAGSGVDHANLTVRVDGRELQQGSLASSPDAPRRAQFAAPWATKERKTLVLDYDLPAEFSEPGTIGAAKEGFYVADPSAFPAYLPPFGIFVKADPRARAENIEVTTPDDFRVLAAGRERKTVRNGAMALHQFRVSPSDFPIYVIAGRYLEQSVKTSRGNVIFWTSRVLDAAVAQAAAERLAATAATCEEIFGTLAKESWPVRVVEMPARTGTSNETDGEVVAASFPQGILLDETSIERIASEPVLERAEYELAASWFGWRTRTSPETQILLQDGISRFAVVRAAESRGGVAARNDQISQLLARYDSARLRAADGALLKLPAGASGEQKTTSAYRAALFLLALEDLAGQPSFDRALRRFWTAMAGREIGVDDLRSALEADTGRDLAPVFRTWLNVPGIPEDFRRRYAISLENRTLGRTKLPGI